MEIQITIPSSCEDSVTTLVASNADSDYEMLLSITSPSGQQNIYILVEDLAKALKAFC